MTVNLRTMTKDILTKEKREVPMQRHFRSFVVCFALSLMAAALVTSALGQATEGFENGIPASWSVSPPTTLAGTADSTSGLNPTEGTHYGWISTGCIPVTSCPAVATTPASYSSSGVQVTGSPVLGTPTVETTLTSPIFVLSNSGTISFDVNFITTDGTNGFADYAVVTLIPQGIDTSPVTLFVANTTCSECTAVPPVGLMGGAATLTPPTASFTGATVTFGSTTYGNVPKFGGGPGGPSAWIHVSYPVSAASYQLRFLVAHVGDTSYPSALAIDNVQTPLESQTQTLEPGVTAVYPAGNDNSKWTPSNNQGGELLTVTAVPILRSVFDATPPTSFPGESCVPYADFSAANGGQDTCVEFQAVCAQGTASSNDCETFLYQLTTNYDLPPDQSAIGGPDFLVLHGATCPQTSLLNQSIFLEYGVSRTDPHTTAGGGGISCFVATFRPNAPPITGPPGTTVSKSQFVGWESPVVDNQLNMVKAGSTRPLKFQWFDPPGSPNPNLTWCPNTAGTGCTAPWVNLQYFFVLCPAQSGTVANTATDISSPGNSGFQNLGGGNYQMNWQTQKPWKGSCANVEATFSNGLVVIPANPGFQFN
jgi:hypothetical protein